MFVSRSQGVRTLLCKLLIIPADNNVDLAKCLITE